MKFEYIGDQRKAVSSEAIEKDLRAGGFTRKNKDTEKALKKALNIALQVEKDNATTGKPTNIVAFGYNFSDGPVDVTDEHAIKKLSNNSHFRIVKECEFGVFPLKDGVPSDRPKKLFDSKEAALSWMEEKELKNHVIKERIKKD